LGFGLENILVGIMAICVGFSFVGLLAVSFFDQFRKELKLINILLFDPEQKKKFKESLVGRKQLLNTYVYLLILGVLFIFVIVLAPLSDGVVFYILSSIPLILTLHLWLKIFFKSHYFKLKLFSTAVFICVICEYIRSLFYFSNGAGSMMIMILFSVVLIQFYYAEPFYSYLEAKIEN